MSATARPIPADLHALGVLSDEDLDAVERASEFLLRLRNELHFHAGRPADVLDRAEQLRIAELRGYRPQAGLAAGRAVHARLLPPHRRRSATSPRGLSAKAQSRDRMARLVTVLFGHRVEDGIHVGPAGILATRRGAAICSAAT